MSSTRTETQTSTAGKSAGPAKLNKDPTIAQIFESLEYGPAPEAASSVNSWLDEHGRDFGHFVNGKWVKPEGRKVYETRNPATGQRYFLLLGLLLLHSTSQCLELGADPTTGELGGHNFMMYIPPLWCTIATPLLCFPLSLQIDTTMHALEKISILYQRVYINSLKTITFDVS